MLVIAAGNQGWMFGDPEVLRMRAITLEVVMQ